MDGLPLEPEGEWRELNKSLPTHLRQRISEPLVTGVRAIDGLLTVGRGQRVGIFAGSGVEQVHASWDDCTGILSRCERDRPRW